MPKAPRLQEESQFSPSTLEYLQRLRNIKEEFGILDLIEPQYEYPETAQVFTPVIYLKANGAPYNFRKRISKATKHSHINITHCPPETLAYLLDTFPESSNILYTGLAIDNVPSAARRLQLTSLGSTLPSSNDIPTRPISPVECKNPSNTIILYANQTLHPVAITVAYRDLEQWPPNGSTLNKSRYVPFHHLFEDLILIATTATEDPLCAMVC
ncbi:hypothetical protein FS837_004492 [Tulasnella sp. UAMH 9824]|nr:hypothetical protein FS837_004492 [Tulasnella sp. UAMH 9824]